jgi:hypothetical protein
MDAWEIPARARALACVWALAVAVAAEGMGIPRPLTEEEERWLRDGVGCVAPTIWWVGLGSEMSTGRMEAFAEVDDMDEALLATDADWARRAVSSRVKRLTCDVGVSRVGWTIR